MQDRLPSGTDTGMITGKRVLVVDDEFMVAAMLVDALEEAGAVPVGPASSLREGLDMVSA